MSKSKKYRYRAICHTPCFWLDNLWSPGEIYDGDIEPGKHFSQDGDRGFEKPPESPAFDKRSNVELTAILKSEHNFTVPRNWNRKQIWSKLQSCELNASKDELTNPNPEKKPNITSALAHTFKAACGFRAKTEAGKMAHERKCQKCKDIINQ